SYIWTWPRLALWNGPSARPALGTFSQPSPVFAQDDEQLTFLCILFAMIVIGNILVIMAIALSPKRRSRMNIFIMNLAIA
ncbi:hypothetical protein BaRGS_00033792, partial [Batillaria attramentaria]